MIPAPTRSIRWKPSVFRPGSGHDVSGHPAHAAGGGSRQAPGPDSRAVKFSPALSPRDEDTLYTIRVNDQPAGSFHLIFQNETVYFYGFEIQEPLRNQGIGTRAAAALIEELNRSARPQPEDLPVSRVLLQVSGDNEPALALYRKLGFAFTETLSYYVY